MDIICYCKVAISSMHILGWYDQKSRIHILQTNFHNFKVQCLIHVVNFDTPFLLFLTQLFVIQNL